MRWENNIDTTTFFRNTIFIEAGNTFSLQALFYSQARYILVKQEIQNHTLSQFQMAFGGLLLQ